MLTSTRMVRPPHVGGLPMYGTMEAVAPAPMSVGRRDLRRRHEPRVNQRLPGFIDVRLGTYCDFDWTVPIPT